MLIRFRDDFLLAMENKPKFLKEITEVYQLDALMEIWNYGSSVYRNSEGITHMIDAGLLKVVAVEPVIVMFMGGPNSRPANLTVELTLKGMWVVWNCKRVLDELNKPYHDNMFKLILQTQPLKK